MNVIKILFWNIKNNLNAVPTLSDLCLENKIDIAILCEVSKIPERLIVKSLRKIDPKFVSVLPLPSNRTLLFHNKKHKITKHHDGKFYSLFKIKEDDSLILLISLHLPSMLHLEEEDIGYQAVQIKREIEIHEKELLTNKTIVVGDFNLNPFSKLLVSATGFNAVMDDRVALKKFKTVSQVKYSYFYNPMWTLHGNVKNEVLGTYFYHKKPTSYIWNVFDQVIIRPELIERFNFEELEILNKVNDESLLNTNGRPNDKLYSDHLPIKFEII
ncbi:hypothetical protein ABE073_02845 [Lederbergia citrisecunda]|uniref:hypothetical protein n=1 Tax=Lederbergia citrisecunda TaxID=2833583 RepID=UPI003D2E9A2D